jgi:hypothetical protein
MKNYHADCIFEILTTSNKTISELRTDLEHALIPYQKRNSHQQIIRKTSLISRFRTHASHAMGGIELNYPYHPVYRYRYWPMGKATSNQNSQLPNVSTAGE